ncbi:MAG: hypothetical protein KGJ59_12185 [Bacteroidota bacterium]|nr:hypothetical protein [Bacteroidota bacterium]
MKKIILLSCLYLAVWNTPAGQNVAAAQDNGFGAGVMVGAPTGISMKLWQSRTTALDGAIAWSFGKASELQFNVDYVIHNFGVIKVEKGSLPFYYGIGARVQAGSDASFGVRIPLGLDYLFEHDPLDVFFEIAPILQIAPSTEFDLDGTIGVRFFFGQM